MSARPSTVFIIDDDPSVRRALGRVMMSAGLAWESFESAEAFLATAASDAGGCIVADMTMQGVSGVELKLSLDAAGNPLPVILLTAQDADETRDAARQAGAAAYFRKPVDIQALLDAVQWALTPTTIQGRP